MSRLNNLKKPELVTLANDLGVSPDGIKSDIEARIAAFLADNPAVVESNETYAAYHVAASSPIKSRRKSKKLESVKHSPEEDDKDQAEDADNEEPVERTAEEPDVSDETTVFDKSKEFATNAWDVVKDAFLDAGDYFADASDSVRNGLSSVTAVSGFFTALELAFVLQTIVPVSEKAVIGYLLPVPHFEIVTYWKTFWLPLILWTNASVIIPLIVSYFLNFTSATGTSKRARAKAFTFDPFVFNGVRLILGHFFYHHWVYYALNLPLYGEFVDALTKAAPLIGTAIGGYSLFAGVVTILVTLYAAAL